MLSMGGAGRKDAEGMAEFLLRCPGRITRTLEAMARRHRLTVNTIVQGAWALILGVYSGSKDVVFGATSSGRSSGLPGIEGMVGLLVNSLPTRVQLRPEHRVVDWLKQLQEDQVECGQYEYTPLVDIQEWSGVARYCYLKAFWYSRTILHIQPTTTRRDARHCA